MNASPRADAIAILGKSQGTKPENRQLWARIGMAAALWYESPEPKPYIIYVAAHDVPVVEAMLDGYYAIPRGHIVTRWISNCTFVEARAIRDVCDVIGLGRVRAVTHPYHATRTRRYLEEVVPDPEVVAVERAAWERLRIPTDHAGLFESLPALIDSSQPPPLDHTRERTVETVLNGIHAVDPGGHFERWLANVVRVRPP
ncbi:MAG: DUF218 domain-containing protein, partial [Gemmatimonadetes bacterium]|nr:DUF218 domain-containing protein [Gemmatimonadota bacterium]